jgi:hypothetical protein
MISRFNLLQSFNDTPYLFYKKNIQIKDQFFLYMGPGCNSRQETKKLMNEWWDLVHGFSSIIKYHFSMALIMIEKTLIEIN